MTDLERPLRPLQAMLPDELALAAGIEIADARRIISLGHRTGALPVEPKNWQEVFFDGIHKRPGS